MNNGVRLKQDSRDRHAHVRFGQTATFEPESNFGFDLYSVIEPDTAVSCTAFSTTKVRGSQTKSQYDVDNLWSLVPHGEGGADPRDTLSTAIKNGLKDFSDTGMDYGIKGYYRADTGALRTADNVRSAMTQNNSSIMINSYWYKEWNETPVGGVLPIGKTQVSTHSYIIVDWKLVNGVTMFLIDSHQGVRRYMPFEVMEAALTAWGASTLMPSTQEVLDERNKTILETIRDLCVNVIVALKALILIKKQPVAETPTPTAVYNEVKQSMKENMITKWAKIIADLEGAKPALNNPGNFKYSPLLATWGATKGSAGSDGGNFAVFLTYEIGFQALCNFLTLGCHNELASYHNARTIKEFTLVYTNHPKPQFDYSDTLIKRLGVTADTDISTFLAS